MSSDELGILGAELEESFGPRRPGDSLVAFLAPHKRFPFKGFATLQYGLSSSVVYVIRCDVAKGFVIATCVVVADKPRDLLPQIVGIFPDKKVDLLLAGPMVALNLAIGLGMIRGGKDVA